MFTFQTVMPIILLIGSNVFMTVAWYGYGAHECHHSGSVFEHAFER